jgi:hypothetical protein
MSIEYLFTRIDEFFDIWNMQATYNWLSIFEKYAWQQYNSEKLMAISSLYTRYDKWERQRQLTKYIYFQ